MPIRSIWSSPPFHSLFAMHTSWSVESKALMPNTAILFPAGMSTGLKASWLSAASPGLQSILWDQTPALSLRHFFEPAFHMQITPTTISVISLYLISCSCFSVMNSMLPLGPLNVLAQLSIYFDIFLSAICINMLDLLGINTASKINLKFASINH